jgi:uroporphyrinogen-III synthase
VHHPEEVRTFLDALSANRFACVVLLTGAGVTALFREAEAANRLDETVSALRRTITVCRGPKPGAALKRYDVPVGITTPEPYTTREVLGALAGVDLAGRRIGLLHYGERSDAVARELAHTGATVEELCLYEWQLPDDVSPLETLVTDLIAGSVDAIAFTSQIQCRHLFEVAARANRSASLTDALASRVVVAAIGPVCASALRGFGVVPHVMPSHPKMGPMIVALADYLELTGHRRAGQR